jgi:hypothetical protein
MLKYKIIFLAIDFLCLPLFFPIVFSQQIVTDTIYINFAPDSLVPVNYIIKSVTDRRNVNPKLISYSNKNKYILLPVDIELCTHKALEENIKYGFQKTQYSSDTFSLDINYFLISRYKGHFSNPYLLQADIPVYQHSGNNISQVGTLVYNSRYQLPGRKMTRAKACEEIMKKWHTEFKFDMLSTINYTRQLNPVPQNLVETSLKRSHFLHGIVGSAIGLNFWMVEGELFFTRPETGRSYWFLGNIIRYQHTRNFEMIGFGKKSEYFVKRINENWSFNIRTNFLLGLTKWKDTEDIKLYQVLQLSFSSSQCISYDMKNASGFQFKSGLFENFYYIASKSPGLHIGLYLSVGYKF